MRKRFAGSGLLVALALVASARGARAQDQTTEPSSAPQAPATSVQGPSEPLAPPSSGAEPDIRSAIPNLAYAYTAYGASAKTLGAMAYGLGVGASGQHGIIGGGLTLWGSPIDRITIVGDGQRNAFGDFAPSLAVMARLFGKPGEGWTLGALGKLKVDGFAAGPDKDEIESEIEIGALVSYGSGPWHLDMNTIGGMGTGDDGEVDVEGRLRFARDVGKLLRVGLDGQARVRLAGPKYLPNGRIWDFAAGPQILIGSQHFFGALTGGPTTTGLLSDNIGWDVLVSVGGSTL